MESVMKTSHLFSQVPKADIQRSSFDRSHGVKTTFNAGDLVPIYVDEALPGDTFNLNFTGFARMSTPIYPVMDNLILETFFFAVPMRLVWNNFQKFNGEQVDPGDSTDFVIPTMTSPGGGYGEQSLSDYFGIPTKVASLEHSSLWHRAYNLIWNEWFRDQNLQDSVVVDKDDGPDDPADYVIKKRGKRHDYFTSCLPWPQKGDAVSLPLGSVAPVQLNMDNVGTSAALLKASDYSTSAGIGGYPAYAKDAGQPVPGALVTINGGTDYAAVLDPNGSLEADLSSATAATINSLREAFQLQRMLERDARGGTRYTEIVRSHFGVVSPDARLQRPEFLGGGRGYVNVHPVPQTSETGTSPQGNVSAFATASVSGNGFVKSFTEHTLLIGLVSVRADLNYQQGLNRMFSRSTRYDFYWPALAHLGEQAVLNKEIYADASANDDLVFGYQERYAEYRYKPSQITGQFRSNSATPLDSWHLAEDFGSLPTLNNSFIQVDPPMSRVLAVSGPDFLLDCFVGLKCARPMPVYSVPGLIDHF